MAKKQPSEKVRKVVLGTDYRIKLPDGNRKTIPVGTSHEVPERILAKFPFIDADHARAAGPRPGSLEAASTVGQTPTGVVAMDVNQLIDEAVRLEVQLGGETVTRDMLEDAIARKELGDGGPQQEALAAMVAEAQTVTT